MTFSPIYPWQTGQWQSLWQAYRQQRLAHALLFYGSAGIGKLDFARALAITLLCESQDKLKGACGKCKSCQQFMAGSHPSFEQIQPEEGAKAIKVDQIRTLIEKLALTGHGTGYRVIILSPADAMNVNAANSLLKTLEEPPERCLIMLVTDRPSRLMATIRSRTQQIRFDLPAREQALSWLSEQNGIENPGLLLQLSANAPLLAKNLADSASLEGRQSLFQDWLGLSHGKLDAIDLAGKWLKSDSIMPLNWVYSWVVDMIRLIQGGDNPQLINPDMQQPLQKMAGQVDLQKLYNLLDRITASLRLSEGAANQQMLLEGVLLHWAGIQRT